MMFWKEVRAMAQRGRKPKPTAVKVLEGNPGKRSLNTNEPKPVKKDDLNRALFVLQKALEAYPGREMKD